VLRSALPHLHRDRPKAGACRSSPAAGIFRLDLSFTRFDADAEPIAMPHDLAVLMVGIAARQAASRTAAAQARARAAPEPVPFAPSDGAFNGATAHALAEWRYAEGREGEEPVYPGVSADLQGGAPKGAEDGNEDGAKAPREV
jgi:hypothetical protein